MPIPDSMLYGVVPESLPPGTPGHIEVVAIGDPVRSTVPVVVRNNSDAEVALRDNEFIGILHNGNAKPTVGTAEVTAICFDAAGSITGYASAFSEKGDLAPDDTTPFSATIYGDGPCDRYLIGATGFRS